MKTLPSLVSLLFLYAIHLWGQDGEFPHPELEWRTIETPHFFVHYHEGAAWTAQQVASIAEAVYQPITDLYGHRPDSRVSIVVRDHDDYSNGAAYFYDNRIEIWAPALDFELRGTHPWLLNVVTHEFAHIVQIQTAMKMGRRVPAIYFQWLGYEAERRPDVLYGFPNIIVSYPLSGFLVPSWFAEGVAQYNHPDLKHDYWDSHRDMILRSAILDDVVLSWEEMAVFGKTSLGNEQSYNAGFSIVKFIAERYGVEKLTEISKRLSKLPRVTIDGAVEEVLGKSGEELYKEWKEERYRHYNGFARKLNAKRIEGELVEEEGFGNFYPSFSPDGRTLAYISNKGRDHFGQSSIYLYDLEGKTSRKVVNGVRSTVSFSTDGRYLYYSRLSRNNPYGSKLYDLYRYDLQNENEERLTQGLRAFNPQVSPDGKQLVFVLGKDGSTNIGVCDINGQHVRQVTSFSKGEQVFTPSWSPDGNEIAFGFSTGHRQSLAVIQTSGESLRVLIGGVDARNPRYSRDGERIYYASDASGVFNLYSYYRSTEEVEQLTNVVGGAFVPAVNDRGDIAYALYTSDGYKIALTANGSGLMRPERRAPRLIDHKGRDEESVDAVEPLKHSSFESKPYRNVFTSLSLIPLVRVDNYNPKNKGVDIVKGGLYFTSYDMLDKLSLFGGAAINRKLERDLFFIVEYKDHLPLFYQLGLYPIVSVELYNLTRKTTNTLELPPHPNPIPIDITYNLFEFDVSLRHKLWSEQNDLRMMYTLSRYGADIGSFVNPNDFSLNPGFRNRYFIGNTLSAMFRHNGVIPSVDSEINPVGRSIVLRYSYEFSKFNVDGDFEVLNGLLVPRYTLFRFHRGEVAWREYLALPLRRHTLSLGFRAATTFRKSVDSFFDSYLGGFVGMKGYPFYALGGNDLAWLNLTYRFPIFTKIQTRLAQFYFTKLYASVFADVGDAWTGRPPAIRNWKTDAGFELRLEAFSFYAYPTRFFFSGAYGFNRFTRTINNSTVEYGKEWRFYLGVLFGFELGQVARARWYDGEPNAFSW
ncbi:MAG TPA: biopolymer transporter Tol [Bacteroidota bacterium]|nr:biopolymer transporter Tol [Bacteroidota bacterium]